MANFIQGLVSLHNSVFETIQKYTQDWLLGLAIRFIFASVVAVHLVSAGWGSLGSGFPGILIPEANAYISMVPHIFDMETLDPDTVPWYWKILVYMGTYAEILLPLMIVLGLFTRIAGLGFIGFLIVMTYADINWHNVDTKAIGEMFNYYPHSKIADQRLLWAIPPIYVLIKGPGKISLDWLLGFFYRKFDNR